MWEHFVEDDDRRAGPAAFEADRCEDFPPPPIPLLERHRFDEGRKLKEAIFARWDAKWAALPERIRQQIDEALAKRPLGRHQDQDSGSLKVTEQRARSLCDEKQKGHPTR
jgi:hypothetical protein